jgi:putative photosynthetic complex assembly protein
MSKTGSQSFPRGPLLGAGALVIFALAIVGTYRFAQLDPAIESAPARHAVAQRDLRFQDRPDGAIAVYEGGDGRLVEVLAPGTNGFIRASLRGLARERKRQEVGADPSFRLTRWDDGRLSLEDPTTGRRIDLAAFGSSNEEAFARLLTVRSTAR